ncbi:response regulator [Desulfobacter latus]|uniref:Response regulator n=1 Tax=Desulfobacter latus TaxID=2292 RepID=A0A850SYD7_9BACT|nr:response regulator [Desulfobacter latus]NWH05150.1 response regulator [Desulfobacter latus]
MKIDPNIKILVVDDSGTMRIMFQQILKQVGFENLIMAKNGNDGIEKVNAQKIDLVISDWNMPEKDGLDFLKWLRSEKAYKDLPFIMATAQADKGQQIAIMEAGGNGHVPKPFTADQIRDAIKKAMSPAGKQEQKKKKRNVLAGKVDLKVAHIQITDHLVLGALKHRIEQGEVTPGHFNLITDQMQGWNPIQDGLENGDIDCAFVLAPIAMDLFAYDAPIKLVLLAHKNGSTFVRSRRWDRQQESLHTFYKDKVVDIPHKMSVHHMLAHQFLLDLGLNPGVPGKEIINVRFEVVPPVQMPGIMKENSNVGAFMVAEPIATKSMVSDIGDLEFFSATKWKDHPCCVVAMQDDFMEKFPEAAQEFVSLLIETGAYVEADKERAAQIGTDFLDPDKKIGLNPNVLQTVFSQPLAIKMNDLYPVLEDLDAIQQYMHDVMHIGRLIDLEKFVYTGFADNAQPVDAS